MKVQRTIPPAAAPIDFKCLLKGIRALWAGGKYSESFMKEIRDYFGVKHVYLLSSGKAALAVAFTALKSITNGRDEVVVPAYTCFSVPSAIIRAGLKVVACDVDPDTFDFDYAHLEKIINKKTLCIVPTHLFGIPADMDRIRSISRKKSVFVVEDAAQAMGGQYKKEKLGTMGDIGIFSLGRGKNITCGSGGIIVTNSKLIARAIKTVYAGLETPDNMSNIVGYLKFAAMALFIHPAFYWFPSGLPWLKLGETVFHKDFPITKMAVVNAALMSGWQKRLRYSNIMRRRNGLYLTRALDLKALNNISAVLLRIPFLAKDPVSRESIFDRSLLAGIGIAKMYPTPISEIEEIRDSFAGTSFPQAKSVSDRLLTLPTHHLLRPKDRTTILELITSENEKRALASEAGCGNGFCIKQPRLF